MTNPKPYLAVVMPYLNNVPMTIKAVESFGFPDGITFILVDNGSENSLDEDKKRLYGLKNTIFVRNSFNLGVGPAWNLGLQVAFYLLGAPRAIICNNDILVRSDTVLNLLDFAITHNRGFVTANNIASLLQSPSEFPDFKVLDPEVTEDHPDFSFFMVSRDFIETFAKLEHPNEPLRGYFDPNFAPAYFEDNDYHRRCILNGLQCVKTHSAPYYHYGSMTKKSSLATAQMVNDTYIKNFYYYATKWGGDRTDETFTIPFEHPFDAFKILGPNVK